MNEDEKKQEHASIPRTRGKIIAVKDENKSMRITVGLGIIYYFLYCTLIACIALTFHFLMMQNFILAFFPAAFIIVLTVTLVQEKRQLFLKVSYPAKGIIRINSENLDYTKDDIRIIFVGIKSPVAIAKYDYYIQILNGEETIYSEKINYVREGKIEEFVNNLVFEENSGLE